MMKLMIPGKVRHQGLEFYESNEIFLEKKIENGYQFKVSNHSLLYSTSLEKIECDCLDFPKLGYCAHLAGVEAYINYHPELIEVTNEIEVSKASLHQRTPEQEFAHIFLEQFPQSHSFKTEFSLYAYASWDGFSNEILWECRIFLHKANRSYVISDLSAFLKALEKGLHFQFGNRYFEKLDLEAFDIASQNCLIFLMRLLAFEKGVSLSQKKYFKLPLGLFREGLALLQLLPYYNLTVLGRVYEQVNLIDLEASDELFHIQVRAEREAIFCEIVEHADLELFNGQVLFYQGNFYLLTYQQFLLSKQFRTLPLSPQGAKILEVSWADQARLAYILKEYAQLGRVDAPRAFQVADFKPEFFIDRGDGGRLNLSLSYLVDGHVISNQSELDSLSMTLDYDKHSRLADFLNQSGFVGDFARLTSPLSSQELYEFFTAFLPELKSWGQVSLAESVKQLWKEDAPTIKLGLSGHFLDVHFDFSHLNQADLNLALEALNKSQAYWMNSKGELVTFDEEFLKISETLQFWRQGMMTGTNHRLPKIAGFQFSQLMQDYKRSTFSEELLKMSYHLAHPSDFPLSNDLKVRATLRPYQLLGVKWLAMLDYYGLGGILADDMGLGKTLQTIAFLSLPLSQGKKTLILAPAGLIFNWQEEFEKFYPDALVTVVSGNKEERLKLLQETGQVVITSYHSFRQDLPIYQEVVFDYLILDEAQVLKNSRTKIAQALSTIDVPRVFALSGTPIENHVLELWSIFQIVLPGLLGKKSEFKKKTPQEIAHLIQPFILRRRKEQVLKDLPLLTEQIYQNELTNEQKTVYLAQLQQLQKQVSQLTSKGFSEQRLSILAGLTRLRQICNSPSLFMPYDGKSGKLELIKSLLLQLKENGHRTLIFSQFRGMLDLVEEELEQLGLSSYKITGSTPSRDRQEITKVFNKGSRDSVLISLKAGGVGLNLTGADAVILIDLWWNPAVDQQAIGRAHRLGQTKQVTVYRLLTHGTIEEKIFQLQEQKRDLVNQVLQAERERDQLTLDDVKDILGISG